MAKKPVKYCVVDAFTDEAFTGNPAAVCLLEDERDEQWLQSVATEFNILGTCYLTRIADSDSQSAPPCCRFRLRWFTPVAELELCGHATRAASQFLFSYGLLNYDRIEFSTLSGILTAKKVPETKIRDSIDYQEDYFIKLDFPVFPISEFNSAEISQISKSLNVASVVEIQ